MHCLPGLLKAWRKGVQGTLRWILDGLSIFIVDYGRLVIVCYGILESTMAK